MEKKSIFKMINKQTSIYIYIYIKINLRKYQILLESCILFIYNNFVSWWW